MKAFFITGGSRGLGSAMVQTLLSLGFPVWTCGRTLVSGKPEEKNDLYNYKSLNIGDQQALLSYFNSWLENFSDPQIRLYLINNASILYPMGMLGQNDLAELSHHWEVNLTAPLLLMNQLAQYAMQERQEVRILNISSGAGRKPIAGWAPYCAAKAGLDMVSRVLAEEANISGLPLKVFSVAPGKIDTAMQRQIREADIESFPLVEKFIKFKEEGELLAPKNAADKIVKRFLSEDWANGALEHIRDWI